MAEDMVELLRQLKVDSVCVFGFSDGGMVGLDMAMHHPDLVTKLAVTGANFRLDAYAGNVLDWLLPPSPRTGRRRSGRTTRRSP